MPVVVGDEIILQRQPIRGADKRVSSTYPQLIDDVKVGDRVLVEDGMIRFLCIDKSADELRCRCTMAGVLKTAKGINLPGTQVSIPSITARDWECIDWAITNNLDYLALSFIRRSDEINAVREHLRGKGSSIQLIAKIEKSEAVSNIDSIIEAADGLMIARGDLGVEMDVAEVPIIQKDLLRRCQAVGKPAIVATQMLQSMIEQSTPTRAEVSDVANAIFDGTDAVMLSGETAVGKFPMAAVSTMAHIAQVTEDYLDRTNTRLPDLKLKHLQLSAAVAKGVRQMASDLQAKLIVVHSQSATTSRIFSKCRFPVPIIALSSDPSALRRMALQYGIRPMEMARCGDLFELVAQVDRLVRKTQQAAAGDRIIVVAGSTVQIPGTMNGVVVHTVGGPILPAAEKSS
jgi:pyruvate kinase